MDSLEQLTDLPCPTLQRPHSLLSLCHSLLVVLNAAKGISEPLQHPPELRAGPLLPLLLLASLPARTLQLTQLLHQRLLAVLCLRAGPEGLLFGALQLGLLGVQFSLAQGEGRGLARVGIRARGKGLRVR